MLKPLTSLSLSLRISISACSILLYSAADGSGFISLDLACLLPLKVTQGRVITPPLLRVPPPVSPASNTDESADSHSPHSQEQEQVLPYAYQVRVFSSLRGVFKGTVVVNPSLPARTLLLRPSMRKVPPVSSAYSTPEEEGEEEGPGGAGRDVVSVEVVNTSSNNDFIGCVPLLLSSCSEGQGQGTGGMGAGSAGRLNRFLIMLLHANGVFERIFQHLAR